MSIHSVLVLEVATGKLRTCELDDDLKVDALLDIEDAWNRSRQMITRRLRKVDAPPNQWPQSLHWNWTKKSLTLTLGSASNFRIFGLRVGGEWQAAMLTLLAARLPSQARKPLVYVDYLESAPWNWTVEEIGQTRRFGQIGKLMLRAAVEQSRAEGRGGRVGLHALSQAAEFYRRCGMKLLTFDAAKEDLPYFEFTEQAAQKFLSG